MPVAMRKVAAEPEGPPTRRRGELRPGIRSLLHLRHATGQHPEGKVTRAVHLFYYRSIAPDLIEIVRILHEWMEPSRYLQEVFQHQ